MEADKKGELMADALLLGVSPDEVEAFRAGAFAEAVHAIHGDRVLVLTGQLWAAENDARYNRQFPQACLSTP